MYRVMTNVFEGIFDLENPREVLQKHFSAKMAPQEKNVTKRVIIDFVIICISK